MRNALTIDVEDYFQVNAFSRRIRVDQWDSYPLRVVENTKRILDLLDRFEVRATFFILGWVAERRPSLVREISDRGHEIACHGFSHQLIYKFPPEVFREDVRRAKAVLEDISGSPVIGYRAPSYSITGNSLWALDILIEEGFTYDSSIFPIIHDVYGIPGALREPHQITRAAGKIHEFPVSTINFRFLNRQFRLPVGGGGYLRLFPVSWILRALQHLNIREKIPAVLYFHPWEIDPEQPHIPAELRSRFRHYLNLDKTLGKISCLLDNLAFAPMSEVLEILPARIHRPRPYQRKAGDWRKKHADTDRRRGDAASPEYGEKTADL